MLAMNAVIEFFKYYHKFYLFSLFKTALTSESNIAKLFIAAKFSYKQIYKLRIMKILSPRI